MEELHAKFLDTPNITLKNFFYPFEIVMVADGEVRVGWIR